ncbi:MAG: LytTR family DNA-binding domain-containing protein [Bacteroidota bacterium]
MRVAFPLESHKRLIALVAIILLATIFFETAQQYYYVTRFNLVENIRFFDLLKSHLYKWLVWAVISYFLVIYSKKVASQPKFENSDLSGYLLLIFSLVLLNILIISVIQLSISTSSFSLNLLINESIPFQTFQKLPIYTLGYFFLAIMLHFYFANQTLQVKVHEFIELKKLNKELYRKLSNTLKDEISVLNVKVGNSQKIIPIKDISWVEAYDYCVRVHTVSKATYVMRISLKALESKLGKSFIRVHRKAIVNLTMIEEIRNKGSFQITLKDSTQIPVASSKLKLVRSSLSFS